MKVRAPARHVRTLVATAVVTVAITACSSHDDDGSTPSPGPDTAATDARAFNPDPSLLVQRSVATVPTMRLAADVTPPTNRWYSSLAFGDTGLPVFPEPLSFTPRRDGFALGLTHPHAAENAIVAAAVDDVEVAIDGADGFGTVTQAGPVAVQLTMGPAVTVLAQGWPAVGLRATQAVTAHLSVSFADQHGTVSTASIGDTEYGVVVTGGAIDGDTLALDPGGTAVFFAVPGGGSADAMAEALGDRLPMEASASYILGDPASKNQASTILSYTAEPTALVVPSRQAESVDGDCDLGTYETIHGRYSVCRASELRWSAPLLTASAALGVGVAGLDTTSPEGSLLDSLEPSQVDAIAAAVRQDLAAAPEIPEDSYFGSKALYRLANLVQIADALGLTDEADSAAGDLEEHLQRWGDPQGCETRSSECFVYDPAMRGVVGLEASFGAGEFNDHHFHYGYLLYAAAVAVHRNPSLADQIGPVMDLVAADIASPKDDGAFPQRRVFDPVAGHSWASGMSPFADGNNQESSSEAVAAWNAMALWAGLRHYRELEESALWMLSTEADAARANYLSPDLSGFGDYDHSIVSIEWGAKRDYATWFSAEPNAILGIQLIPMPPAAAQYLDAVDDHAVQGSLSEAAPAGFDVGFGDYLLMYRATIDGEAEAAWDAAVALPNEAIDDANSRAYLLAWIATHAAKR